VPIHGEQDDWTGLPSGHPANQFRNLNEKERMALATGHSVFRQPSGWRNLSMPVTAPYFNELEDWVRRSGANYLGEVILLLSREQAEAVLPEIMARLRNVEGYAGIPYWSSQFQVYYDLFEWLRVVGGSRGMNQGTVDAVQYMKPFGEYSSTYKWLFSPLEMVFSGINTTALSYQGVKAVAPGNMNWILRAWSHDNWWLFYGLGCVKAFDLFGTLRTRLSVSFMGRIEAFFRYAYSGRDQG
jgi:hypothetical protein